MGCGRSKHCRSPLACWRGHDRAAAAAARARQAIARAFLPRTSWATATTTTTPASNSAAIRCTPAWPTPCAAPLRHCWTGLRPGPASPNSARGRHRPALSWRGHRTPERSAAPVPRASASNCLTSTSKPSIWRGRFPLTKVAFAELDVLQFLTPDAQAGRWTQPSPCSSPAARLVIRMAWTTAATAPCHPPCGRAVAAARLDDVRPTPLPRRRPAARPFRIRRHCAANSPRCPATPRSKTGAWWPGRTDHLVGGPVANVFGRRDV